MLDTFLALTTGLGLGTLVFAFHRWKATCPVDDPPTPRRPLPLPTSCYAPLPVHDLGPDPIDWPGDLSWCPEHETFFDTGTACPECEAEDAADDDDSVWDVDDVVGLGPVEPPDGWYLDLVMRAGTDPHCGYRD